MSALATDLLESATREELIKMVLDARGALSQTAQRAGCDIGAGREGA